MASVTVVKTIGTTGTFSTPQLWEDGAPADLTTAEQSAATTFSGTYTQGENLTFTGSGATGKFLHSDQSSFVTYGITTGNPATSDTVTGDTSGATCVLSSGTADFVGVIWRGECQNQEFTGTGQLLAIVGSTSSATAYKHITTVAGASFRDHATVQTNALRYNAANGCGISSSSATAIVVSITEPNAQIANLQIRGTGASSTSLNLGGTAPRAEFLIIEGANTATGNAVGILGAGGGPVVTNTVIVQQASAADHIVGTGTASPNFYNCTIVASDDLAIAPTSIFDSGASGTVTVQNCGLFAGDSTKAITAGSATFNFTTCYSDISGTAGVTQTTYGNEFQNVNDATRDFRLKAGAAQIDTGTTDATNAAIDIVKTNRPSGAAYDVGAWELVQQVVTPITGLGRRMVGVLYQQG